MVIPTHALMSSVLYSVFWWDFFPILYQKIPKAGPAFKLPAYPEKLLPLKLIQPPVVETAELYDNVKE